MTSIETKLKAMKRIIFNLLFFIIPAVLFNSGCVESLDAGDLVPPEVVVSSPATNDSLAYGKRKITYTAYDDLTFGYLEVYINNVFNSHYDLDTDGTLPEIYLIIDSTFINQKINYYVVAYDKAGNSKKSNVMTDIKITENTDPPERPTNLLATPLNANSVEITWKDNAVNEDGFQVFRRESSKTYGTSPYATVDKNIESFTDNSAPENVTYYYEIRAFNKYGYSDFSDEVNSKGMGPLLSPTQFKAVALSTSQIKLSWKDNSTEEESYVVYRKFSGDQYFSKVITLNASTSEYTDKNLAWGTTYVFKVAAHKDTLDAWSEEIEMATMNENVVAPSGLAASVEMNTRKVILTWSYTGWDSTLIERKVEGEADFKQIASVISVRRYEDANLKMGVKNYYRARTKTALGNYSTYSNTTSIDVPYFPPAAPGNLVVSKIAGSDTEFLLEWKDNSTDEDGFAVYRKMSDDSEYKVVLNLGANAGTATMRVTDIIPDASKMYLYYITSYKNYSGNVIYSSASNIVNTFGGSSQYPKPTNFKAEKINSQSIKLNWDYTDRNDLIGFKIYRKKEVWGATDSLTIGKNLREYTDPGLSANTNYYYKIKAVGYNQESDPSDEVTAKTDP